MRGRFSTCELRSPITGRLSRGTRDRATALATSRKEAQHESLLRARTVPRWFRPDKDINQRTSAARGLSPSARGRGRRASCSHQESARFRVARATATLRSLPLGSRRIMRAGYLCTPYRAGSGPSAHYPRAPHRREVALLRRAAVVLRASCGLQEPAGFRLARATAPLRSLPLGVDASCELAARVRRGALVPVGSRTNLRALHRREAVLLRRAAVVVRASCGPAFVWHARPCHCARCL